MCQGAPELGMASTLTPAMASTISTRMLPEDQVASTIECMPAPAPEIDAFNDDDIEKAIAEIRRAIEKSSRLLK